MKLTDKEAETIRNLIDWFFRKDDNRSICLAFYRKNYTDGNNEMHFSVNSIHGEFPKITSKDSDGDTILETIKDYVQCYEK